ncbi:hypothetical protein JDV02_007275 [Purpureocillium takamizusanense]|uniref:Uncharacterized protein n=1 Tax=Purpureocillium takamizusanense TaxID=2060973 RepID=A0A9Q8QM37_9HYPO|nr:uncharacterized protein JDV02_007275 [Purpureocillium takamizusanense]UNI21271.1 hypothetical protein JDV02_007275 [Purpureocillium takamizusanense]
MARSTRNTKAKAAPAKGRTDRDDLVQSSAAKPGSSSNFRARLRGEEPVREATPKAEAPIEVDAMEEVSHDLRASFDLIPNIGSSSRVMKPPKKSRKVHEAVTQLKELFAKYGLDIYTKGANDIMQAHATIDTRAEQLSLDSSHFITKSEELYSKMTTPLSSTRCHGNETARARIDSHLASLRTGIQQAQKELEVLQEKWDEAFAEECAAWKDYDDVLAKYQQPDPELEQELAEMKQQIRAINQEYEDEMDKLEAKYKADMQAETLRILQSFE